MKYILGAAAIGVASADTAANFGKFFYLDFEAGEKYATHHADVMVGSEDQHMRLWVTTDERNTGVFTTKCSNCNVGHKWNPDSSKTARQVENGIIDEEMDLFDDKSLARHKFYGKMYNDYLRLVHKDHSSRVSVDLFGIESSQRDFHSNYDGYIGLAPPNDGKDRLSNFMMNARKDGLIENLVAALYTDVKDEAKSSLKFGSYDASGIADGDSLTYLKTVNATSWGLRGAFVIIGD